MKMILTDNREEMVEIAKSIVAEKANYYTTAVMNSLRETVKDKLPNANEEELEKTVYVTIYYYWAFGCTASEYFYLKLYEKSVEEIKEFVLTREKVLYRNYLNKVEDAHLLNNKWETYCLFKDYFKRDVILISTDADYPTFCEFVAKHHEFVVKPTDMGQGQGVHKVTASENMTDDERKQLFEELLSECKKNQETYLRGKENSVILEELIIQVPEMAAMHPNSANGIRATTVRVGDQVTVYHPWFKIGRHGQFLTSAVFGTLDAVIDAETGIVITPGCSESDERFDVHPDTGIPIVGFKVPKWDELLATVKELAMKLDNINYVGWDMVLTEQGWVLMEGNFSGDFSWQFCEQRGTKKEFEKLINWKLTKEFWWQE